jgi:hypothetical protein
VWLAVLRWVGHGLAFVGVVLGAISPKAGVGGATAWVPTTATVAAAVAAYAAWARYEYQLVGYLRTVDSLEWMRTRRETSGKTDAAADDDFIAQCERIISDEDKEWAMEWAKPKSSG